MENIQKEFSHEKKDFKSTKEPKKAFKSEKHPIFLNENCSRASCCGLVYQVPPSLGN